MLFLFLRFTVSFPILLYSLAGFCTLSCRTLTGIFHLHDRTTLLHHSTLYARVFFHFSPTHFLHQKTRNSHLCFYFWITSSVRRSEWIVLPDSGQGRVNGLDYAPKLNGFTDIYIFRQLHTQHSLVIYTTLPSRMTS